MTDGLGPGITAAGPPDPGPPEPGRPDDATIRQQLRDRGHNPPARAKLGADWVALWESGEAADPVDPGDSITAAGPPAEPRAAAGRRTRAPAGERPPAKPKASGGLLSRFWGSSDDAGKGKTRGGRGGSKAKPGVKHPRIPVDRLLGEGWEFLARVVEPMDKPVSRCLYYQADVAGLVLEDMVRGSIVDKALQPIARSEARFRKGFALIGPPLLVMELERANELSEPQRSLRLAVVVPMLREAMAQWVLLAGDKLEEKQRREEEMGPVMAQVDSLINMVLWNDPPPGAAHTEQTGRHAAPEAGQQDQAAAWAQASATPGSGFMGGWGTASGVPDPPPRGPYAHPYAQAYPQPPAPAPHALG